MLEKPASVSQILTVSNQKNPTLSLQGGKFDERDRWGDELSTSLCCIPFVLGSRDIQVPSQECKLERHLKSDF